VVFFIDLSRTDEDYWRESKELLDRTMGYKGAKEMPWLVVCNKKDIAEVSAEEAVDRHGFQGYSEVVMKVISGCALTGEGLNEGF
jgi:signal recognition particle receptor subunit beta